MWGKLFGAGACVMGLTTAGLAQQPAQPVAQQPTFPVMPSPAPLYPPINPANVMPNIYNPRTQPLSPYLNLLRGGNAATNYYYGVRPGTIGGAGSFAGAPVVAGGGNRALFFPQLAAGPDPFALPDPDTGDTGTVLPPAGHPVVFGNTMGYFPGSVGSGRRPALAGVGTTRPPTPGK